MHGATLFAYITHAIIFRRDAPRQRCTAYRAVLLGTRSRVVKGGRLRSHEGNSNDVRAPWGCRLVQSVSRSVAWRLGRLRCAACRLREATRGYAGSYTDS